MLPQLFDAFGQYVLQAKHFDALHGTYHGTCHGDANLGRFIPIALFSPQVLRNVTGTYCRSVSR